MPPKANARFTVNVDGADVLCRAEKGWKVTVHVNLPKGEQYKVAIRNEETREAAVARTVRPGGPASHAGKRARCASRAADVREAAAEAADAEASSNLFDDPALLPGMVDKACAVRRVRRKVIHFDPTVDGTHCEPRPAENVNKAPPHGPLAAPLC